MALRHFFLFLIFVLTIKNLKLYVCVHSKQTTMFLKWEKKLNIPFQEKIITKHKQNYELYEFVIDTNCYKKIRVDYKFLFSKESKPDATENTRAKK